MRKSLINTFYTSKPICPYCGNEVKDDWDIDFNNQESTEISCGKCDKDFYVEQQISVTYSTLQLEELKK